MRPVRQFVRLIVAVACLALGAAIGALNRQTVAIDLGAVQPTTTLGVALIVALLAGVIIGGLAIAASVALPLRRQLTQAERRNGAPAAPVDTVRYEH